MLLGGSWAAAKHMQSVGHPPVGQCLPSWSVKMGEDPAVAWV